MSPVMRKSGAVFDAEHYLKRARRPLHALVFLLPFLLLYEIGTVVITRDPDTGQAVHIVARSFLGRVLAVFGDAGVLLPGVFVVVALLAWHIASRDRWEFDWRLYLAMTAESVAVAIPLLMFALIWGRQVAVHLQATQLPAYSWQADLVFGVGAGVYEELVFRLIAIALLHTVFVSILELSETTGTLLAVICSAALFASYHFSAINPFAWGQFIFYALAGVYLGGVFVWRGFGIVAATHAFYDIFYVAIEHGLLRE